MATVAAFHGIGCGRQEFLIQKREGLFQVGREQLLQGLADLLEAAHPTPQPRHFFQRGVGAAATVEDQYMDKLIGSLIWKAEELGIYEETYFVFCADNGTAVTAKDRGVERGVHVPYVVKGPGVKRRGVTDELTDFADVAPTLLDIAGVTYPADVALDGNPEHAEQRAALEAVIRKLPSHLEADHPFWTSKRGKTWLKNNDISEVAKKQLHNHPGYSFYDEKDQRRACTCLATSPGARPVMRNTNTLKVPCPGHR